MISASVSTIFEIFWHGGHGGMAPGIDRIVMLLADQKNIREVTLFPLNQNAEDLLMEAPSEVSENQLKELNISIKNTKKS